MAAEEQLIIDRINVEFMQSSPKLVFPNTVFKESNTLDCGDVTFELYWAGGTHSRSDIFIFVPQKGILFTGDMMADKWLTQTQSWLATFALHTGEAADYPVLLKHWQLMLDRKDQIVHYIPGHWDGELSYEGFKNRFPDLVDSLGFRLRGHKMTINHLYQIDSGKLPLYDAIVDLIRADQFESGFDNLHAEFIKDRSKYFYTEAEINNLGYYFLQQKQQPDNALKLLELNAGLYPDSWNAYDSLGEAVPAPISTNTPGLSKCNFSQIKSGGISSSRCGLFKFCNFFGSNFLLFMVFISLATMRSNERCFLRSATKGLLKFGIVISPPQICFWVIFNDDGWSMPFGFLCTAIRPCNC